MKHLNLLIEPAVVVLAGAIGIGLANIMILLTDQLDALLWYLRN